MNLGARGGHARAPCPNVDPPLVESSVVRPLNVSRSNSALDDLYDGERMIKVVHHKIKSQKEI